MFSHVVIFWTDPAHADAADKVVAGAKKFLQNIPGVLAFHVGKMAPSQRPVVDQTYQVALNIHFSDKHAEHLYQSHPEHLKFIEQCCKPFVKKVVVYDFE
jgi:Stress responsive A/B Barrel Domain